MPANLTTFDPVLKDQQGRKKMPSVSKAQRRFFGGWEHNPGAMHGKKPDMSKEEMHDYASTSEDELPETSVKKAMKATFKKKGKRS